ncbi:MAG: hypothetical protein KAH00_02850 [Cocleimonas sp.]|nr:hypothetical protein [Cocleimonas sp.]
MKKILLSAIIPLVLMHSVVIADDVTDQIKAGLTAYEDKDYRTAVDELKFAVAQLEKLKNTQNQTLLPEALEGWKAENKDNNDNQMAMAMLGGGTSIKGKYTRKAEKIEIEVLANSPLLAMMTMMLNNPAMMAGQKNTEPFRYKKAKGMKKKNGKTIEITLLLAGQIMIKVVGKNLEDEKVLKEYLNAFDFAKLKEALL